MYVRKARAGSSATHTWPHDGAVVEVPDDLGAELLSIPDGGFTEVRPDLVDAGDAGDAGPVANAGLIRLAVVAEMTEVRRELGEALDRALVRLHAELLEQLRKDLTAGGTAAPAAVSTPSGGPAEPAGVGPAGAGPPDGPQEPAAGTPASRRATGGKTQR